MKTFFYIILLYLILIPNISHARCDEALVTRVVDGDTIVLRCGSEIEKGRLIGIDTPETVHPRKPVQCYGPEASSYVKKILTGKTVNLTYDQDRRGYYGRLLVYVHLPRKNKSFNLMLVRQGYARVERKYPFTRKDEYLKAEKQAKESKKGLWLECESK